MTQARAGIMQTRAGTVNTPAFMPVGTRATVKGMTPNDLEEMGFELILANTYHLEERPGSQTIKELGGLHKFMGWNGSILTDSGGFQVFSLAKMRELNDEGVEFSSPLDGARMKLTPESCMRIQEALGVDIAMVLDECPPYPCTKEHAATAVRRTYDWAKRSIEARGDIPAVFGIVQGSSFEDLRVQSAQQLAELDFDGLAIGGVSVGEQQELIQPVVDQTAKLLPASKPRYLMGVGHPSDIIKAVASGVDLFDCVLPTRMARHGVLYTLQGRINITAARYTKLDDYPDPDSIFPGLERFSAAYLRHLMTTTELLGMRLATLHNLHFYARMMREMREAIVAGSWDSFERRYANV